VNYLALYNYTKDIIANISPETKWFHGRKELITPMNPEDLIAYCLPFISTGNFVQGGEQVAEIWEINIFFYKKDDLGSGLDQNDESGLQDEINILAQTSVLADDFVRRFNFNNYTPELEAAGDKLTIRSFTKGTAIKDTPHVLTGTFVTMRVEVPDDFDYCPPTP
jgi:hypothetical protein